MEDFVPFELAVKLNEKGYPQHICEHAYITRDDEENERYVLGDREYIPFIPDYLPTIASPTISQVLKWLIKEKRIFVAINIGYCYESDEIPFPANTKMEPILKGYYYGIWELDNLNDKNGCSEYFEKPELAALAGIEYVIDNLI